MSNRSTDHIISTHSIGEGLDFACNLLAIAVEREANQRPERASTLLRGLTFYISLRYAGEYVFALGSVEDLAREIGADIEYRREQFRAQVEWCARTMGH